MMRTTSFRSLVRLVRDFYWLTRLLGVDYLWYDKERRVIEIWGPYYAHQNKQSEHVIRCELDFFKPKLEDNLTFSQKENEHVQETAVAC